MYMSTRRLRKSSNDDGAVLVEFALVVSLFFLLVFGMIDFGLAINAKTQMTNAGREGARLATVDVNADVEARVRDVASNLDQAKLSVTVVCQEPDDSPCDGPGFPPGDLNHASTGDSVIVTVDYIYDPITPLSNFIGGGGGITLRSVTEMRVE